MAGGVLHSGLTRLLHSVARPPSIRTIPTSVTRSPLAVIPVVSRSTKATGSGNINKASARTGVWNPDLTKERSFVIVSDMSNDRSYLAALQDYYAAHRALPSYSSIGALLGLRSKSSVAALVARLKLAGFVESTPDRRLAPTRNFFQRPLAEAPVHAGLPNPIDDGPAHALTAHDYLIDHPVRRVAVRG